MADLTEADRAAFIVVAELLGCHTAAQHIRDDRRRRGLVQAAPAPAPRPGPKPKLTPPRQPAMNLIQGGGEDAVVASRSTFSLRMARLADEAVRSDWASVSEKIAWAETARSLRLAASPLDEPSLQPPAGR